MSRLLAIFREGFLVWVVAGSLAAWWAPEAFVWFEPWIVPGLGVIMLGMGLTLRPDDFTRAWRLRGAAALGVAAQYSVMPLAAGVAAALCGLDDASAVGVFLVAACPGGTASNIIAYLARADVALSVTMTAVSTILSPVATPLVLWIAAGERITVPFSTQAATIARIVLVPVLAGTLIRAALDRWGAERVVRRALEVFPALSVAFVVLIVSCIVGLSRERIAQGVGSIGLAVVLVNAFGLLGGYAIARAGGYGQTVARTVALEVGMQNSGLGVALAMAFFGAKAALPSALFSVWHNITGPALAQYWSGRPAADSDARG